jgi:hypothetical protein
LKSLGIFSNPILTWEGEAKKLLQKSNEHAVKTMSHQLRRGDANIAHRAILVAKMTYSLPVTRLSHKQL